MDELPKDLPEQVDVTQQRRQEDKKSDTRFPLNVFADCVGADGIKIMGHALGSTTTTSRERRKHPPLSRERLEAFLEMSKEQQPYPKSVLGAVTWDHGTVLFPLGDDLEAVAGFDGGSSTVTPLGGGGGAAAAAAASRGKTPPQPTAEELLLAQEEQRHQLRERTMRIANGNFLPPPPPSFFNPHHHRPYFSLRRSTTGAGGALAAGTSAADGDDSEVSSPTFAPTDSEFPATATATSLESAHSSDIARADAAAIEAATRGLNPMSAQAAILRAAAIHRREQRLKRRKEQSIILSNLERHERYGLAEMDERAGSPAAAAAGVSTPLPSGTPLQPPVTVQSTSTPHKQYLSTFASQKRESSASPPNNANSNNNNNNNKGTAANLPRVGSRSSVGDTATDDGACSSMPDLMSATPSEAGAAGRSNRFPSAVSSFPFPARPTSNAARSGTSPDTPSKGDSSSANATPSSKLPLQQQQSGAGAAGAAGGGGGGVRPPPPPFSEQPKSGAAHASTAPFSKAAAAAAAPASDEKKKQQRQQSQTQMDDDDEDDDPVCGAAGDNGLTERDLLRLQKQEQAGIRNKVTVEDFGDQKGRGVRSNNVFVRGNLIFRVRPDLGVVYSDYCKVHCAHCFRPSIEGRTVASSSSAAQHVCLASCESITVCPFCECFALCKDCGGRPDLSSMEQKGAVVSAPHDPAMPYLWQRHMAWCRWLRTLPASVRQGDTDYLRFFLEYASRVQCGDARLVESISTLCSLEEVQSPEVKQFCDSFSALISNTFTPRGLKVSQAALREALLRVKCNALGFPFTREATIGWATHGTVCMLNHSCDPNAALTQSPLGEMEVRALRQIPPSEEITISYVHLPDYPSKQERRRHLLQAYRFLCRCDLCLKQK